MRVELAVHGAIGLSVHGWPDVLPADINIDRDAGLVRVSIAAPGSTGAVTGSMVRVRSISGYHDEALDLPSGKFRPSPAQQ